MSTKWIKGQHDNNKKNYHHNGFQWYLAIEQQANIVKSRQLMRRLVIIFLDEYVLAVKQSNSLLLQPFKFFSLEFHLSADIQFHALLYTEDIEGLLQTVLLDETDLIFNAECLDFLQVVSPDLTERLDPVFGETAWTGHGLLVDSYIAFQLAANLSYRLYLLDILEISFSILFEAKDRSLALVYLIFIIGVGNKLWEYQKQRGSDQLPGFLK